MDKSIHQTAEERRAYINQVRSSFQTQNSAPPMHSAYENMAESTEEVPMSSTLGIRTVIAILIFAAFIYCDKEKITYHDFSVEEVFQQIEWNPLPMDDIY